MSGTFFLVSQWGFEENTNDGESTEESASKNRSNCTEIIDKKSIHSSSPKNRAECLIW